MSTEIAKSPTLSVRRSRIENYDRGTADRILDVYNGSKKGDLPIDVARRRLVKINPVLLDNNKWLSQRAHDGARKIGGYPVAGRDISALKSRISYVGAPESMDLFKELVRVGTGVQDEKKAFSTVSNIAPEFLDVPGITFPPPHPFSNPRVRALFDHPKEECKHDLPLRRDGLYFVEDEDEIVEIIKNRIIGEISKEEAIEQLKDIHRGLLQDYDPPSFS